MKSLYEYLTNEEYQNSNIFEGKEFDNLQEVYEEFGMMLINDYEINEGGFGKFADGVVRWANRFAKWGHDTDNKVNDLKKAAKDKIDNLSREAQSAIETVKKKAGDKWTEIKDAYTSAIAIVDEIIGNQREAINTMAKNAGIKVKGVETAVTTAILNIITNSKELGGKIIDWSIDKTAGAFKLNAMVSLYIGLVAAKKAGLDQEMIASMINTVGIKL